MIDYFAPVTDPVEACLRQVKGNFRRQFLRAAIEGEGLESVPLLWREHELSQLFKEVLQRQDPRARGGEDLPDLDENEVEIARLTLADSVHGEVASLRARKEPGEAMIRFCLVDEYETEIDIPCEQAATPLSAEQVIGCFRQADPCQTETDCEIEFQSYFYQDLKDVAITMGVK